MAIDDDAWAELEVALQKLRLFEHPRGLSITHGICQPCYETMMQRLEDT